MSCDRHSTSSKVPILLWASHSQHTTMHATSSPRRCTIRAQLLSLVSLTTLLFAVASAAAAGEAAGEAAAAECPKGCSGRGECIKSICVCRRPFTGVDCSEEVEPAHGCTPYRLLTWHLHTTAVSTAAAAALLAAAAAQGHAIWSESSPHIT